MSEAVELKDRYEFHERRYFLAMNGLVISFLLDAIMVTVVMVTNGKFDPGIFLYVPIATTVAFGALAVLREFQAKKDKVRDMDYFGWIMDKLFGKSK